MKGLNKVVMGLAGATGALMFSAALCAVAAAPANAAPGMAARSAASGTLDVSIPLAKKATIAAGSGAILKSGSKGKIVKVKTSNRKIVDPYYVDNYLSAGKKGTATLTVTTKKKVTVKKNGKKKKVNKKRVYKMKVKVVRYASPVKSLLIGGTENVANALADEEFSASVDRDEVSISVKPKKGWKLRGIYDVKTADSGKTKKVKLKNGKMLNVESAGTINVILYNKKKNQAVSIVFTISRSGSSGGVVDTDADGVDGGSDRGSGGD